MFKTIRNTLMGLTLGVAAIAAAPADASAYSNDHCREYTRTVNIGGRIQEAYGTACLQADGSWIIVGEGLDNDIPEYADNVDYVIRDNRTVVRPPRVVYYSTPSVSSYRTQPTFVWYNNGRHYKNGHYVSYKRYDRDRWDGRNNNRWDRHDNHNNHHDNNRGRGRDRH